MITVDQMQRLLLGGGDVLGSDGKKIGSVGQLFLDATTGEPAWVTAVTGLFGTSETFVPLTGAVARGDDVEVAFDKDRVKHAPRIDGAGGSLSPDEERALYRHYGLLHDDDAADGRGDRDPLDDRADDRLDRTHLAGRGERDDHLESARGVDHGAALPSPGPPPASIPGSVPVTALGAAAGTDRDLDRGADPEALPDTAHGTLTGGATALTASTGATSDDRTATAEVPQAPRADEGMVLRAERARVIGTERVPTERVRMRRYTVTEQRTISIPVSREEYRVEYEPAEGAGEPLRSDDDPTPDVRPAST